MEIRKATIDDFDQIKDLKLKAKASEGKYNTSLRGLRENRKRYFSYLRNDLTDQDRAVLIAIDRDQPIGMITGRIYRTLLIRIRRKEGRISNLLVLPGHRKKGIATELVRELLKWFRKRRIKDIRLAVHSGNAPALEMFSKLRFQEYLIEFKKTL
jgi:ribosomal protein S18 acetylase RimI-like enzyme